MNEENIRPNSLDAWLLASRPKTLTGAVTPVILGLALAAADGGMRLSWVPAVLCLLFAVIMQIDANFVNDYFDWRRGNDDAESRLGPMRACSMGWVTPKAMRIGILLTTVIACVVGLPLVLYGGWEMIIAGILCVVFCFLYTTTLSYLGMGDILVIVFFGLVPVGLTYYLQMGVITGEVCVLSLACGLVIDNLLIVNNYRDIDNDRRDGKRTLVVRIGERMSESLYFLIGFLSTIAVCACTGFGYSSLVMLFYLICHLKTYQKLCRLKGRELNRVLGLTARNNLFFGLSASIVALLQTL